jgi:hypothetical protein
MGRTPTGRQKRCVNPEIVRTFTSTVHNVSPDLGTEQLQKRLLSNLQQAARYNSVAPRQCPHGTQIHPPQPTVSVPHRLSPDPPPQILHIPQVPRQLPLARRPLQPFQQIRHRLGTCTIVCPDCNALHWTEEKSRKSTRQVSKFSTCCMNGAISLPQLPDAPVLIQELLEDDSNGNCCDISEAHYNSWVFL